ncbi:hypothetical protein FB45DRAFT_223031 [Roridomyces roridus]|uniref:F-box domain-containing protein n=1 Tax=Roridomyces roridus TaxID=1738132 RepID=A0AAD7BCX7_9AGAR|nr:hypothetical protein FB45DRAFT_223031 [Roridomyces roridus]
MRRLNLRQNPPFPSTMTPLPLDLLQPILSHVDDKSSLLELCLVARSFLPEAQRRLYDDVALSSFAVVRFCEAVTKPVSQPVASFVRRLSIEISGGIALPQQRAIALTLSRLPSLEALEFSHQPAHWVYVATYKDFRYPLSSAEGILTGFNWPFRLKTFASGFYMSDPHLLEFLEEQSAIEELVLFTIVSSGPIRLPPRCLPNLKRFWSPAARLDTSEPGRKNIIQYRMDVVMDVPTLEHHLLFEEV